LRPNMGVSCDNDHVSDVQVLEDHDGAVIRRRADSDRF